MRYSQSEKMEIIRIVENSELSVKRTLEELDVNRSTFYEWYRRYQESGYDGLAPRYSPPNQFWNEIPPWERDKVVEVALDKPELSPRELAWHITDTRDYYISESSVYRILKAHNLITSPVYTLLSAADKFSQPTRRVNELWQTDFTYLKVIQWGWYYLSTVLDDYSRYIISWDLFKSMSTDDVKVTVDRAVEITGVRDINIMQRPRLLSDNGSCYVSGEFRKYLKTQGIKHVRGAPYHPMTQGKIERYHRSMKNIIKLTNYYSPEELNKEISKFVEYYNQSRYHEGINNLTPADVYAGKGEEILATRKKTKVRTMKNRRSINKKRLELQESVS